MLSDTLALVLLSCTQGFEEQHCQFFTCIAAMQVFTTDENIKLPA